MDQLELKLKTSTQLGVGASKIGGRPSVPDTFTWPVSEYGEVPLGFVLQLNFAELQAAVPTEGVPNTGLLQLFCTLEETELGSGEPEHAIVFHAETDGLADVDFPEDYDEAEGTLEQRSIEFGVNEGDARMFGDAPELGELDGAFDPEQEVLLELDAYGNVTRVGESHSIFGEGRFVLVVAATALAAGKLDETSLLFVGGT